MLLDYNERTILVARIMRDKSVHITSNTSTDTCDTEQQGANRYYFKKECLGIQDGCGTGGRLRSPPPSNKLELQLNYSIINLNSQVQTSRREAL